MSSLLFLLPFLILSIQLSTTLSSQSLPKTHQQSPENLKRNFFDEELANLQMSIRQQQTMKKQWGAGKEKYPHTKAIEELETGKQTTESSS